MNNSLELSVWASTSEGWNCPVKPRYWRHRLVQALLCESRATHIEKTIDTKLKVSLELSLILLLIFFNFFAKKWQLRKQVCWGRLGSSPTRFAEGKMNCEPSSENNFLTSIVTKKWSQNSLLLIWFPQKYTCACKPGLSIATQAKLSSLLNT